VRDRLASQRLERRLGGHGVHVDADRRGRLPCRLADDADDGVVQARNRLVANPSRRRGVEEVFDRQRGGETGGVEGTGGGVFKDS
jgi:hypothetical protein